MQSVPLHEVPVPEELAWKVHVALVAQRAAVVIVAAEVASPPKFFGRRVLYPVRVDSPAAEQLLAEP